MSDLPCERILHVDQLSKAAASGGGASKVAEVLAGLLADAGGVVSRHWIVHPPSVTPVQRVIRGLLPNQLDFRLLRRLGHELGLPDMLSPAATWYRIRCGRLPDVIHVHDTLFAFAPWDLARLARRRPLVWTIHDCSAFTGGCLYPLHCRQHEDRCRRCPAEVWSPKRWPTTVGWMQDQRRSLLAMGRVVPVAPSAWMARMAERSARLPAGRVQVVRNPVDNRVFAPVQDQSGLRRSLGLDPHLPTVLISASSLEDPRKDSGTAIAAVNRLGMAVQVILVGRGRPPVELDPGIRVLPCGYVGSDTQLARLLAAADALLFPTLADNLPNTVAEALASGTPVVAAAIGGVPEQIVEGRDGFLVPAKDPRAMGDALARLLQEPRRWDREGIAERARAATDPGRIASEYLAIYRTAVAESHAPA
jgi:glycosyltransferase involved in cell wall biosynthesis